MTKWPNHYPKDCPPSTATETSGEVYRFTNKTQPINKDFISYYELNPTKDWGNDECQAKGLSIFITLEDCLEAAEIIPALKKKKIAVGKLKNSTGAVASTPSTKNKNHKTLWPLIDANILSSLFSNVAITRP